MLYVLGVVEREAVAAITSQSNVTQMGGSRHTAADEGHHSHYTGNIMSYTSHYIVHHRLQKCSG